MTRFHHGARPDSGRSPALAVSLARLETCARTRDTTAAARVLDDLPATDDGAWLLLQMAAAGLRALSTTTQHLPTARTTPAREHTGPDVLTARTGLSATLSERTIR